MRNSASLKKGLAALLILGTMAAPSVLSAQGAAATAGKKPEKSVDDMIAELEKRAESNVPSARLAASFILMGQTTRDAIAVYKANPDAFKPKIIVPDVDPVYTGWNTYNFKNYNLKLLYPQGIIIDDVCKQDCTTSIPVVIKSKPNEDGESEFQMQVLVSKSKIENNTKLETYCDANAQWRKMPTKEKMTTLADKPTMTYSAPKTPQGDAGRVYTCTIINGTDLLETIYPVAPVYNEIFKNIVYSLQVTK